MIHWFGMCEFLHRHHFGMGIERLLRQGYVTKSEIEVNAKAPILFSVRLERRIIYEALVRQDFIALRLMYRKAKQEVWDKSSSQRWIDDMEDPYNRLHQAKMRQIGEEYPDVRDTARGFFHGPEKLEYRLGLMDELMSVGYNNHTILNHIEKNMTKGSVIIHALLWSKDEAVKNCGGLDLGK